MKKITLLLLGLLLFSAPSSAQYLQDPPPEEKGFKVENLRFGGDLGLSFGNITYINVSPTVGYQFHRLFTAGIGISYQYYSERFNGFHYQQHIYGGSVHAIFRPIRWIFLQAEYGLLNHEVNFSSNTPKRQWMHYPLVGGGVNIPAGPRSSFMLMALWNLNESKNSIYVNPLLRVGVSIGI